MQQFIVSFLTCALAGGCYSTHVQGTTPVLVQEDEVADSLVFDVLYDVGGIVSFNHGPTPVEDSLAYQIHDELATALAATGVSGSLLREADAASLVGGEAFLVRYRLVSYSNSGSFMGFGRLGLIFTGFLLPPLWFGVGALPAETVDIESTWEMRVYDVRGRTTSSSRDLRTGELIPAFDTSDMTPLLRRDYEVDLEGGLSGPDHRRDDRHDAAMERFRVLLVQRLVEASIPDLRRAILAVPRTGPTPRPAEATEL